MVKIEDSSASAEQLDFGDFACKMLDGEGTPRRLYAVSQDHHQMECFVEANEGCAFQVQLRATPPADSWHKVTLFVGEYRVKRQTLGPGQFECMIEDYRVDMQHVCSLLFAKPAITDDEKNSVREPSAAARLGSVRLTVERLVDVQARTIEPSSLKVDERLQLRPQHAIFENAMKIGSAGFVAGPKRVCPKNPEYHTGTTDTSFQKITFTFYCITRFGLQVKKLVPWDDRQDASQSQSQPVPTIDRKELASEEEDSKKAILEAFNGAAQDRIKREQEQAENQRKRAELLRELRILEAREAELRWQQTESSSRLKDEPVEFDFSNGGTSERPIPIE